jgi:hypothetical protein
LKSGHNVRAYDKRNRVIRVGAASAAPTLQNAASRAFVQILGKLFYFELSENLRRILLDYAQKRPDLANAAFNGAC